MVNVKTGLYGINHNYVLRTQNLIMMEHKVSGIKKKLIILHLLRQLFTQLRLGKIFCGKVDKQTKGARASHEDVEL